MRERFDCGRVRGLVAAILLAAASGATPIASAESLTDAWRMALESDAAVAATRSEREAAEADRLAAARSRWPTLDVNGGWTQFRDAPRLDLDTSLGRFQSPPIFEDDTYVSAAANLSLPVFTSGRIGGAVAAAKAGAAGAAALEARSVADAKLAVAEAFLGVLRARLVLAAATSNVESLAAHERDVQVMYEREAVAQSDLLAVQVALANARQQELRARNALRIGTAAYNRRIGQPLEREPELETPAAPPPPAESLEVLVARAADRRPELAALAARRDALLQSARVERSAALPQVALQAGYMHLGNEILDRQDFASVGVAVQWRLFDGGQVRARTAALRSRARAAEQQLNDLRSIVALEVESEHLNRQDAAARVAVGRTAVTQAEENLRIARELYGSGLGTNTLVLDAEALRVAAVRNRDDAALDEVLAAYRLQRAVGEL